MDPETAWLRLHYQWRGGGNRLPRPAGDNEAPPMAVSDGGSFARSRAGDGGPPRRVAKLYLPPGGRYLGSREGHGLTYTSCQESGKFRGLYRLIAANLGTDEAKVARAVAHRLTPRDRPMMCAKLSILAWFRARLGEESLSVSCAAISGRRRFRKSTAKARPRAVWQRRLARRGIGETRGTAAPADAAPARRAPQEPRDPLCLGATGVLPL
jgi:hypothetical protein